MNEKRSWTKIEIDMKIAALRQFYTDGVNDLESKNLQRYGRRGTPSKKEINAKARKLISTDGYTKKELDQLIIACRQARWVLSRAHLIRLLSVPKGKDRDRLQAEVIASRWSKSELDLQMRGRFGIRRVNAGRRKAVGSHADAMLLFAQFADQWKHLRDTVSLALRTQAEKAKRSGRRAPRFNPYFNVALKKADATLSGVKAFVDRDFSLANTSTRPSTKKKKSARDQ